MQEKEQDQEKTRFNKFIKSEWDSVEKKYDNPIITSVLDVMIDLGSGIYNKLNVRKTFYVCGENIYLNLRKKLVNMDLLKEIIITENRENDNKNKNDKKKTKKNIKKNPNKITKEQIIENNIISKTTEILDNILKILESNPTLFEFGFRASYAELRIITLILCCNYYSNRGDKQDIYELIIGISKIINNIDLLGDISPTCINDLKLWHDKLKNISGFTYETMFLKYPKLCLSTKYDLIFSFLTVKPYKSQLELMNLIRTHNSGLFFYKAMIGSGKTSMSLALVKYISNLRVSNPTLQLIFSCCVEPVRREVCRMAYNKQIPFGIATIDNKEHVRIINNYNCLNDDKNRLLIVSDLESTLKLLEKSDNYILFLDEPTVGADTKNSKVTNLVCKIMNIAPKITVLSSATLPDPNHIPDIVNNYTNRHNNQIYTVFSKESIIGCEMINLNGSSITPYGGCKTSESLLYIIERLKTESFIDRLLPAPLVYKLRNKMIEEGVEDIIDLEQYFSDVNNLNQTNIQHIGIILLEKLASCCNKIITKVCKTPIENIEYDTESDQDLDNKNKYDLTKIFTSQAYKYAGPCLVATSDPIKFVKDRSEEFISSSGPASKMISKYNMYLEKYKDMVANLSNIKNEDERSKQIQDVEDTAKPVFPFNKALRINSIAHFNYYHKNMKNFNTGLLLHNLYELENISHDLNVQDWIMIMLYAGVGIYSPGNKLLSDEYTEIVLNLASEGKLAFLVSNESICYGANYPISHVVICEDIAKKHSMNTIFQLAGRAGRVGESWVAYTHIGNYMTERMMKYIYGIDQAPVSIEAENMNNAYRRLFVDDLKEYNQDNWNKDNNEENGDNGDNGDNWDNLDNFDWNSEIKPDNIFDFNYNVSNNKDSNDIPSSKYKNTDWGYKDHGHKYKRYNHNQKNNYNYVKKKPENEQDKGWTKVNNNNWNRHDKNKQINIEAHHNTNIQTNKYIPPHLRQKNNQKNNQDNTPRNTNNTNNTSNTSNNIWTRLGQE
jgi:hypothetical protein